MQRLDFVLLRLRMVAVAALVVVLGVASTVTVTGLLTAYYLLFSTAAVLLTASAVGVALIPFSVSVDGAVVVPALLGLSVGGAVVLTAARLWILVVPGIRRELQGEGVILDAVDERPRAADGYPRLRGTVTRVAAQFDIPRPEVVLTETTTPEAFSVGYRPSATTLVVSSGVVDALDDDELAAVVAHELAHIANRDAAVMTAATLPLALARNAVREGRNIDWETVDEEMSTGGVDPSYLWRATFVLSVLLYPVAFVGRTLAATLSRSRETVADRAAVTATGSPSALARALATLDRTPATRPSGDLRAEPVVAVLSILPPRTHERPGYFPWLRRWLVRNVYHTHPPTEERIERLRALEQTNEAG